MQFMVQIPHEVPIVQHLIEFVKICINIRE